MEMDAENEKRNDFVQKLELLKKNVDFKGEDYLLTKCPEKYKDLQKKVMKSAQSYLYDCIDYLLIPKEVAEEFNRMLQPLLKIPYEELKKAVLKEISLDHTEQIIKEIGTIVCDQWFTMMEGRVA